MTAKTMGAHHIGLTVPDIEATRDFFIDALNFKQVGGQPDYPAFFVSDGTIMITLWRAEDPDTAIPFDRRCNIGLHHLCLRTGSTENLHALHRELAARDDVSIEFSPEAAGSSDRQHMMCYIPGNVRIEFIDA
jgi:catechol 2,3-dioxygenase-like lactoylglutathione lyase family enzyme